jgi:hypothetical protein
MNILVLGVSRNRRRMHCHLPSSSLGLHDVKFQAIAALLVEIGMGQGICDAKADSPHLVLIFCGILCDQATVGRRILCDDEIASIGELLVGLDDKVEEVIPQILRTFPERKPSAFILVS